MSQRIGRRLIALAVVAVGSGFSFHDDGNTYTGRSGWGTDDPSMWHSTQTLVCTSGTACLETGRLTCTTILLFSSYTDNDSVTGNARVFLQCEDSGLLTSTHCPEEVTTVMMYQNTGLDMSNQPNHYDAFNQPPSGSHEIPCNGDSGHH